jgi:hypothetical protein
VLIQVVEPSVDEQGRCEQRELALTPGGPKWNHFGNNNYKSNNNKVFIQSFEGGSYNYNGEKSV